MSDITDKLRAIYPKYHNLNEWDVRYEAADTIEALRAENARLLDCYKGSTYTVDVLIKDNARLREALKPFADLYDAGDGDDDCYPILNSDLRSASAAMGETDPRINPEYTDKRLGETK